MLTSGIPKATTTTEGATQVRRRLSASAAKQPLTRTPRDRAWDRVQQKPSRGDISPHSAARPQLHSTNTTAITTTVGLTRPTTAHDPQRPALMQHSISDSAAPDLDHSEKEAANPAGCNGWPPCCRPRPMTTRKAQRTNQKPHAILIPVIPPAMLVRGGVPTEMGSGWRRCWHRATFHERRPAHRFALPRDEKSRRIQQTAAWKQMGKKRDRVTAEILHFVLLLLPRLRLCVWVCACVPNLSDSWCASVCVPLCFFWCALAHDRRAQRRGE